jgi:hypothetical protein
MDGMRVSYFQFSFYYIEKKKIGKASQFEVTTFRGHKNYISCFQLYRNNIVSGSGDFNLKVKKTKEE